MKNMNAVQAIIAGPPQIKEKVNLKIATPGSKANNLQTSTSKSSRKKSMSRERDSQSTIKTPQLN
jgi:hypothetical protein